MSRSDAWRRLPLAPVGVVCAALRYLNSCANLLSCITSHTSTDQLAILLSADVLAFRPPLTQSPPCKPFLHLAACSTMGSVLAQLPRSFQWCSRREKGGRPQVGRGIRGVRRRPSRRRHGVSKNGRLHAHDMYTTTLACVVVVVWGSYGTRQCGKPGPGAAASLAMPLHRLGGRV